MTLYLYRSGKTTPLDIFENVIRYTADEVVCGDGTVYGPFGADCELSSLSDCSEALRRAWTAENPSPEARIAHTETVLEEIESILALLLFGGDGL